MRVWHPVDSHTSRALCLIAPLALLFVYGEVHAQELSVAHTTQADFNRCFSPGQMTPWPESRGVVRAEPPTGFDSILEKFQVAAEGQDHMTYAAPGHIFGTVIRDTGVRELWQYSPGSDNSTQGWIPWGLMPVSQKNYDIAWAYGSLWTLGELQNSAVLYRAELGQRGSWNEIAKFPAGTQISHLLLMPDGLFHLPGKGALSLDYIGTPGVEARQIEWGERLDASFLGGSFEKWTSSPDQLQSGTCLFGEFNLGGKGTLKKLEWIPENNTLRGMTLRYRLTESEKQVYGKWSGHYRSSPLQLDSEAYALQYQIVFPKSYLSDLVLDEVRLTYVPKEEQDQALAGGGGFSGGTGSGNTTDSSTGASTDGNENSQSDSGNAGEVAVAGTTGDESGNSSGENPPVVAVSAPIDGGQPISGMQSGGESGGEAGAGNSDTGGSGSNNGRNPDAGGGGTDSPSGNAASPSGAGSGSEASGDAAPNSADSSSNGGDKNPGTTDNSANSTTANAGDPSGGTANAQIGGGAAANPSGGQTNGAQAGSVHDRNEQKSGEKNKDNVLGVIAAAGGQAANRATEQLSGLAQLGNGGGSAYPSQEGEALYVRPGGGEIASGRESGKSESEAEERKKRQQGLGAGGPGGGGSGGGSGSGQNGANGGAAGAAGPAQAGNTSMGQSLPASDQITDMTPALSLATDSQTGAGDGKEIPWNLYLPLLALLLCIMAAIGALAFKKRKASPQFDESEEEIPFIPENLAEQSASVVNTGNAPDAYTESESEPPVADKKPEPPKKQKPVQKLKPAQNQARSTSTRETAPEQPKSGPVIKKPANSSTAALSPPPPQAQIADTEKIVDSQTVQSGKAKRGSAESLRKSDMPFQNLLQNRKTKDS